MQKSKLARRDTFRIISDLLQSMKEPRRVTHLLYTSNLSYTQLVKYLKLVMEMGLAKEQTAPFRSYSITDDGQYFVQLENKRTKIKLN